MIPDPIYKSNKCFLTADEFVNTYIYRPVAWPIVKLLVKTPITANQITLVGLIVGIISGIFYYNGGRLNYVLGALFFFLASVLDCADGPLARLKKSESEFGKIFEGIADYLVGVSVFMGFFLNLYNQGKLENVLLIGILIVVFITLHNMGWDYTRTQFFSIMDKGVYIPIKGFKYFCQTHIDIKYNEKSDIWQYIIYIYYLYMLAEQSLFSPTDPNAKNQIKYYNEKEKREYFRSYSKIMRLWGWSGGKTHLTYFMICSLFNKIDLIIIGLLVGFNLLWLVTLVIHKLNYNKYFKKSRFTIP